VYSEEWVYRWFGDKSVYEWPNINCKSLSETSERLTSITVLPRGTWRKREKASNIDGTSKRLSCSLAFACAILWEKVHSFIFLFGIPRLLQTTKEQTTRWVVFAMMEGPLHHVITWSWCAAVFIRLLTTEFFVSLLSPRRALLYDK